MSTEFFNSAESVVTYAATAAEVILLVRLAWLGLLKEFKVFSAYLLFDALRTVALLGWDYHSHSYEWMWAVSSPLWTLSIAAVSLELSGGLRQAFPQENGNRIAALYGFLFGMTATAVVCMVTHPDAIARPGILLAIIANRCVFSGCILAILAQAAYLKIGGAPLMDAWRTHRRLLLLYMAALVIGSFASTLHNRPLGRWISLTRDTSLLGCCCVWIIAVQPAFRKLRVRPAAADEQLAENIVYNRRLRRLQPALTSRSGSEESLA